MTRKSQALIAAEKIDRQIYVVRGTRVMLDSELAKLYGVATKVLLQAVRRNPTRFPRDFAFRLAPQELMDLRSQIVTSNVGRGGRRYPPYVFTEQGVAMLSSVLRSPTAVRVNIEIMRAFVRLRRLLATPGELVVQLSKLSEAVQLHDEQIKVITEVLRRMMEPPPEPEKPKRGIGFRYAGQADDAMHNDGSSNHEPLRRLQA